VDGGAGRNRQLEKIAALIDWAGFEQLLGDVSAARVGRPSYGAMVLLKCLLLQQWYRLSDPGLEESLSDRLSFRRFAGLALADPVPDHSTVSRFRSELSRRGLTDAWLAELNRQLDARGLMVKTGTLIDAWLVAAAGGPREDEPNEGRSDADASWNAMPEKPLFGYKRHLAVDRGSGLVRQAILTPGHRHTLAAGRRALLFAAIARPLGPLKRQAVLDYRALASRHDRAFEARWLHGGGNDAGPPRRAGHLRACRPRGRLRSGAPHNALAVVEGERSAPRAVSE
jgi:transposase